MASLYIKDGKTADRVARVADRLGTTKTEAINRAVDVLEERLGPEQPKTDWLTWMREYRRLHPLPPPTGRKADKAFFDEMWGEEP